MREKRRIYDDEDAEVQDDDGDGDGDNLKLVDQSGGRRYHLFEGNPPHGAPLPVQQQ